MSMMTLKDQHVTKIIESHTSPLIYNLKVLRESHIEALKRLEVVEKDNDHLKRRLIETLDVLQNHFGPAE